MRTPSPKSSPKQDQVISAVMRREELIVTSALPFDVRNRRRLRGTLVDPRTGKPLLDAKQRRITSKGRASKTPGTRPLVSYRFDFSRLPAGAHISTVSEPLKHRAPVAATSIVLFALLALALLLPWHDPHAQKGNYDGKTKEEIARDLDNEVDWWSMEVSIRPYITIAAGQTTCEARIENVPANHCDQVVTLSLMETGETIYQSGAISPGEYLQSIELAHPLKPGTHDVLATFQGYEQNLSFGVEGGLIGHERFGASCSAQIQIECNA